VDELMPFGFAEQRQLRGGAVGVGGRGGQQRLEMAEETDRCRSVEQVGRRFDGEAEAGFRLDGEEGEIELGGAGRDRQRFHGELGETAGARRTVEGEGGGEQRVPAQAALRAEARHQQLEGHRALVRSGQRRPRPSEEVAEGRRAAEIAAQHHGVDEQPHGSSQLAPVADRDRAPHRHVVFSRQPGETGLEGCQESGEEGAAGAPAEGGELSPGGVRHLALHAAGGPVTVAAAPAAGDS
jgi:hypothetical protein